MGPHTTAQSDEYAIAQALDAATVVIAIVPQSLAKDLRVRGEEIVGSKANRLVAIVRLGGKAFKDEGASVDTSIVIFGHAAGPFIGEFKLQSSSELVDFGLVIGQYAQQPKLRPLSYESGAPVITPMRQNLGISQHCRMTTGKQTLQHLRTPSHLCLKKRFALDLASMARVVQS